MSDDGFDEVIVAEFTDGSHVGVVDTNHEHNEGGGPVLDTDGGN
jgi:hypothetical protein